MQTTKQSNQKMFSSTPHAHSTNVVSKDTKKKSTKNNRAIDILHYLIPPNDDDSSCFVKSSN